MSFLARPSPQTMGWLMLVASIKLQVSFAKEPHKRDAILQKRPIILSILLIVATPYPLKIQLKCGKTSTQSTDHVGRVSCILSGYGVATISRIDKIIGLFCRIACLLWCSCGSWPPCSTHAEAMAFAAYAHKQSLSGSVASCLTVA